MEKSKLDLWKKGGWRKLIKIMSVTFIVLILLLPIFRSIQDDHSRLRTMPDFALRVRADPISIDGNTALNNTARSGNGTVNNPYIIENKVINASGKANNGISIQNTNAYFIFRNCTITDTYPFAGILLHNVTNGKLINNTLNNNCYGIYLIDSYNISLTQNIVNSRNPYTSIFGIYLFKSSFNSIANNTAQFSAYGIYLWTSSNNNTIQNNTANNNGHGIYLEDSNYNKVTRNVFHNNNVEPYYETSSCIGNIIENNDCTYTHIVIDGNADFGLHTNQGTGSASTPYILEDIRFELAGKGINGIVIQNTDAHFIIRNCTILNGDFSRVGIKLHNVTNGLITNNTVNGNDQGINVQESCSVNITQNLVYYNDQSGIYLDNSHDIRIINNTVRQAMFGIDLFQSNNNTLWYNKVIFTDYDGISLDSASGNTFINNTASQSFQYGFHLWLSSNNTFINNTSTDNWFSGFSLSGLCDNNTLINNIISSNYQHGIQVDNSDNNTISRNTINDNGIKGVRLYRANYNYITWNTLHGNPQAINETECVGNIIKNNDFGLIPATLYSIFPNPNTNGLIKLNWSSVFGATRYYVYRSTSIIESVVGLKPIAQVLTNNYSDRIHVNATFYYIIIAGHSLGNSSISNCENVTVLVTQTDDGVLKIVLGVIIIGAIAIGSISIYSLRRKKKLGAALSVATKLKNLSLTEKLQLVITKRIPLEDFEQLNAPDLMNLIESEIGIISSEVKTRASKLPISDIDKNEILQELARLPAELQLKLLSQLEDSISDTESSVN